MITKLLENVKIAGANYMILLLILERIYLNNN
jgi:hypothetical protein